MFIVDLNSGGAEWQLARLAVGLKENNFTVKVVCMNGAGEVFSHLQKNGIDVECLNYNNKIAVWRLKRLATIIKEFKPDILHCWMFHANFAGKIIGTFSKVHKKIYSIRVAEKERPWHVELEKIGSESAAAILCNSNALEHFLLENGFPRNKLHCIQNSFDSSNFEFTDHSSLKQGIWKLLFVGRVTKQKGLPYLLESLQELKKKNINFFLTMVGAAPENEKQKLENLINKLSLQENITISPPLPRHAISELMKNSHLLVLPSLWEGMPNVVMEAFASGLPVLATRVEGSEELIEKNEERGTLCESADSNSLKSKLLEVFENYDKALKKAKYANSYLITNHNTKFITKKYIELYKSL